MTRRERNLYIWNLIIDNILVLVNSNYKDIFLPNFTMGPKRKTQIDVSNDSFSCSIGDPSSKLSDEFFDRISKHVNTTSTSLETKLTQLINEIESSSKHKVDSVKKRLKKRSACVKNSRNK